MTRKKPVQQPLLPKLRFPDFQSDGEWKYVPLGNHAIIIKERAGTKKYPVMSIETGVGLVSQLDKFGRDISGNSYKNYTVIQKDDFAYNKSATKKFPEGFIAKHKEDNKAAVPNSIFTCFRLTSIDIQSECLYFQLLNNLHGKWLSKFITVGARAHGALSVNTDDLMDLPVPVPSGASSATEQQKIADCLGSLDDLIAAHSAKLGALQDHKKGLLQQLFPAEGQSTPSLRFPEFMNSTEWKSTNLGQLVDIRSGHSPSIYELSEDGPYAFLKVEDLNNCTKYQQKSRTYCREGKGSIPQNSIIFPKRGAAIFLNKIRINLRKVFLDTNLMAITPSDSILTELLYYSILRIGLSQIADTSPIPQINNKHIIPFSVYIPSMQEQQKIADCLSTVDALISAQTEQIAALKEHKKGLMQQLFPNPELSKA